MRNNTLYAKMLLKIDFKNLDFIKPIHVFGFNIKCLSYFNELKEKYL